LHVSVLGESGTHITGEPALQRFDVTWHSPTPHDCVGGEGVVLLQAPGDVDMQVPRFGD
jgi:hypothetical protein